MKIRKLDTSNHYNRNNGYNLAPKLMIGYRLISSCVGIMMSVTSYSSGSTLSIFIHLTCISRLELSKYLENIILCNDCY